MSLAPTLSRSEIPGLRLLHSGKVRDVYEVDDKRLLLVATDRISAFDCILPTPIRHKGHVLTALSAFWFRQLASVAKSHYITDDLDQMPEPIRSHEELRVRSMLVKKTEGVRVECEVRG